MEPGNFGKIHSLKVTGVTEGVEVFVNGQSLGLQIVPDYEFDLKSHVKGGWNQLTIECATTLARENPASPMVQKMTGIQHKLSDTGIHGKVTVTFEE